MKEKDVLNMPKIDLHCHLDGSVTKQGIEKILGREVGLSELQVSSECRSLAEYLEKFDLPLECIQTPEGLKEASKEFLLNLQEDNIKYVEVRFAPQLSTNQGMNCTQVVAAVLEGLKAAEEQCGIYYQVIACMMRHHSEEMNLTMLKECREFLGEGLCAVDLAGDESGFPTGNFYELFRTARKMDYPFTIHAGECGSVQSILDAVEIGAGRIGHGIAMKGNPEVQKLLAKKRVGVEMCPLSNYQTKAVKPGEQYPIREFSEAGVLVTVNTDNRTVSNTNLGKEMMFLQKNFEISDEELYQYQKNALEAAFCDELIKHEVWKLL